MGLGKNGLQISVVRKKRRGSRVGRSEGNSSSAEMVLMGLGHKHNPCLFSRPTHMSQEVAKSDTPRWEVLSSLGAWALPQCSSQQREGRGAFCVGRGTGAASVMGRLGLQEGPTPHLPDPSFSTGWFASKISLRGT